MNETYSRCVPRCENCRFSDTVQARCSSTQTSVRQIAVVPNRVIIVPSTPWDAMPLRQQLIHFPNPHAFDPAQLLDATTSRRFLFETHGVHLADNLEPRIIIQRKFCLIE